MKHYIHITVAVILIAVSGFVGFTAGKWGGHYEGWTECYKSTTFPTQSQFDKMMEAYQ